MTKVLEFIVLLFAVATAGGFVTWAVIKSKGK